MENNVEEFVKWIKNSDNIVFFGGAGVSTESGIPDFRSVDGLYNQKYKYPPETILSHSFYIRKPEEFFEFYRNKMLFPDAEPSTTHIKLAELEKSGKLKGVITQNIDGLHQKAGSSHVIELHGSVLRNYCERCGKFYGIDAIINSKGVGGTSLGVYPAAGLIDYYNGNKLVLINKSETPYDRRADLLIHDALGNVFSQI